MVGLSERGEAVKVSVSERVFREVEASQGAVALVIEDGDWQAEPGGLLLLSEYRFEGRGVRLHRIVKSGRELVCTIVSVCKTAPGLAAGYRALAVELSQ